MSTKLLKNVEKKKDIPDAGFDRQSHPSGNLEKQCAAAQILTSEWNSGTALTLLTKLINLDLFEYKMWQP